MQHQKLKDSSNLMWQKRVSFTPTGLPLRTPRPPKQDRLARRRMIAVCARPYPLRDICGCGGAG